MSKISIKTDFQDGDKLFAADLNNNFRTIQAGVNANEENLEEIIEQAIVRLDNELIEITADRGWDWNGGERVTFYKGDTDDIEDRNIINGQMLYNTETGETYLDDNNDRIVTGSGNVVSISDTEPANPATKLWINPDEGLPNVGTEVVNSMVDNQTNMAPSVHAAKEYANGLVLNTMSGTETDKAPSVSAVKGLVLNTMSGTETDKAPSVSAVKGYVPSNANIVNLIYPVGSIYMSYNSTSPATLFGGTWTKLENCFLYASGTKSVGNTGGSETVTLTKNQIPAHTHTIERARTSASGDGAYDYTAILTGYYTDKATTSSVGGGEAHNNMPPYLVVNMWRRTA